MADFIARLKVDSKEYDSKIDRARSGLLHLEESLREAGKDFRQADSAQVKFVQDLGKMETVSRTARGQMNELKNAFTDLSVQYKRMSDLERQSPIGKAMSASLGQLKGRIATLRTDLAGVEKQLGGMSGIGMGGALKGAFSMFGPAALAASGVMAAMRGLREVTQSLIQTNMQFEQSSANLAAVLGTTRDQTTALTAQAKQLGATTQYTAIQITDLQTNLARLGFTQQEILASTKAIQDFATATRADLGEAANLAGAALRGFGMNAAEMERVASVLAVSTTKSALSFEKLATALPTVAPVAKQFGFSIEDTVTLLGKLSDAGLDASTAGTATRKILLNLADANGKLAQALGRPVHNVEELGDALVQLKEKGLDLNKMLELTDVRSVTAFATFVDNAATLRDFKNSITDCADALQGMVDEQLNTLQGSVTIMKSAWEGLMLTFSNSNGILKQTTDALTRLLTAWTNWNNRRAGGDAAIGSYEQGLTTEAKGQMDRLYKSYKAGGTTDQQIKAKADSATESLIKERDAVRDLYDQIVALNKATGAEYMTKLPVLEAQAQAMFPDRKAYDNNYIAKYIAGLNDRIASQQYLAGLATPASVETPAGGGGGGIDTETEKASERAAKAIASARENYALAIERATVRFESGLDTEEQTKAKELAAHEQLYEALTKAYNVYADPATKAAMEEEKATIKALAKSLGELKETNEQLKEAEKDAANKLRKQQSIDNSILRGLNSAAARGGWNSEQLGTKGFTARIEIEDIPDSEWQALADNLNEHLQNLGLKPIEIDFETGSIRTMGDDVRGLKTDWTAAAHAVAQFGSALQSVEDPTVKVAGIIAEAIASIAAGAGAAIGKAGETGEAGGPWGWIAFAISAAATTVSTIAAIKNATKFAEGGIVPGNSFNGDQIVARLNSGEGVLTRKGIENAGAMMASIGNGNAGGGSSNPYVTGENIVLGVNNYLGRSGQGEIVTTGMLRRAGINL